jgi:hypothetical protein
MIRVAIDDVGNWTYTRKHHYLERNKRKRAREKENEKSGRRDPKKEEEEVAGSLCDIGCFRNRGV